MPESPKFTTPILVPCYDTDAAFRMKPAAFMDHAQEIAYAAATHFGFGYDALQAFHTAWVLSRMHIQYVRPPHWRDAVNLTTWHKGMDGLFFHRDFVMKDARGEDAIRCTSSWLVIDTVTRHLVRSNDVLKIVPEATIWPEDVIAEPAPKVLMPKDGREVAGEHCVAYSDVDIIGHTNNVRYIAWAMDAMDYADVSVRNIRDIWINFNHETHAGDRISLERIRRELPSGGLEYYVEGTLEGRSAFVARFLLD